MKNHQNGWTGYPEILTLYKGGGPRDETWNECHSRFKCLSVVIMFSVLFCDLFLLITNVVYAALAVTEH